MHLLLICCKLLSQILVMCSGKFKLFFFGLLDEINSGVHFGLLSLKVLEDPARHLA